MKRSMVGLASGGAIALLVGAASAYPPNGYGPDPDGDSNPATNTQLFARIGDAAEAALDTPFQILTFDEAGYSGHGETIRSLKTPGDGLTPSRTVKFSKGLNRQLCEGQLYFRYDTQCTYMAAPSGKFAALYRDDWGRPLRIRFEQPVCAAALALYPTGGEEGERYEITLTPYGANGRKLNPASYQFEWTKDTFRWRLQAGAFFINERAERVDVNIESVSDPGKIVRFLIDDVAFIEDEPDTAENDCLVALQDINDEGKPSLRRAAPSLKSTVADITPRPQSDAPAAVPAPIVAPTPLLPVTPPAPARAAFEASGLVQGVRVALTDDRCTASVLFDDATLRGSDDRLALPLTLPLRIVGGPSDMTVEARGYLSSPEHASAYLTVGGQTEELVEEASADDSSFATASTFSGVADSGALKLDLAMAEPAPQDKDAALFAMDSLDLTLADCSR